jgi:hypothetical protein
VDQYPVQVELELSFKLNWMLVVEKNWVNWVHLFLIRLKHSLKLFKINFKTFFKKKVKMYGKNIGY